MIKVRLKTLIVKNTVELSASRRKFQNVYAEGVKHKDPCSCPRDGSLTLASCTLAGLLNLRGVEFDGFRQQDSTEQR